MSENVVITSNIVTAIATFVLAFAVIPNLRLARSIRKRNEEHEQEMKDLLQALVIAHLSGPYSNDPDGSAMQRFKKCYKGKTPIF